MHRLLLTLLATIMTLSLFLSTAEAARFGGGKSFGMSRSASSFNRSNFAGNRSSYNRPFQTAPASAHPAQSGASKWLGPLAGFAAGGLLTSLFMGHGFGSGFGMASGIFSLISWLFIGGAVFFLWRFIRGRLRPAAQFNPPSSTHNIFAQANSCETADNAVHCSPQPHPDIEIDEAAFLRNAKTLFIRLQAAYDNKNLNDIREFTLPEIFAEIQMQLQERGDASNQTDVLTIDAELKDYTQENQGILASVLFSGFLREEANTAPENIKEIWHFRKSNPQDAWRVAGIEQMQ